MEKEYLPHVILAEDDPDFRAVLGEFLAEVGYNVVTVSDAPEALDYYNRERENVGLIITDLCMPKPDDGINLIHHIHQLDNSLPIVAMSGNSTRQLIQEFAKLDIAFFHKPFDFDALYRFIERKAQRHLQEPRRIINMIRRGGGFGNTVLPGFLANMSNVPDAAKDRCIIAVTGLNHMSSITKSRDSLLKTGTTFLNLCTGGRRNMDAINQDDWTKPVTIIGSLHTLAYDYDIERIGKIVFFGGAAMLPPNHPARMQLENKLYRENSVIENRLSEKRLAKKSVGENSIRENNVSGNRSNQAA